MDKMTIKPYAVYKNGKGFFMTISQWAGLKGGELFHQEIDRKTGIIKLIPYKEGEE